MSENKLQLKDGMISQIYSGKYFTISEHVRFVHEPQHVIINGEKMDMGKGFAISVCLFNLENKITQCTYFLPQRYSESEHKELQAQFSGIVCDAFITELKKAKKEISDVAVQA